MTEDEMNVSLEAGLGLADEVHAQSADLVVAGEMGIGNTTAASAITAMLTDLRPAEVSSFGRRPPELVELRTGEGTDDEHCDQTR